MPDDSFGLGAVGDSGVPATAVSVVDATPQALPPAVTGANMTSLDVRDWVPPGGKLNVSGTVHYNDIFNSLTPANVQVRVTGPDLESDGVDNIGWLLHCNSRSFDIDIVAPRDIELGQAFEITVQSLHDGVVDEEHTRVIEVITEEQARDKEVWELFRKWAPWAVGGMVLGVGSRQTVGIGPGAALVGGAGVGLGAGYAWSKVQVPEVSTTDVILATAVLGAGAYFLSSVTDVAGPIGSFVGNLNPF